MWLEQKHVPVEVNVSNERKYIKLEIVQRLNNISIEKATEITNKINSERLLARFFCVEIEDRDAVLMVADYYLSFDRGLIAYHLVNALKFFERIVVGCVRENFMDNLKPEIATIN